MRLLLVTVLSCAAFLPGCGLLQKERKSPYLRDSVEVHDAQGVLIPGFSGIRDEYLNHMLDDLDACYSNDR